MQCDEGRPTCKKCEKAKRVCGGYRQLNQFRAYENACTDSQNDARNSQSPKAVSVRSTSTSPLARTRPKARYPLPQYVQQLELDAFPAFGAKFLKKGFPTAILTNHAMIQDVYATVLHRRPALTDTFGGAFSTLPKIYGQLPMDSPLYVSMTALGLALIARLMHRGYLSPDAIQVYGRAVTLTRQKLMSSDFASLKESVKHEMLLTTLVLCVYEVKHSLPFR